MKPNPTRPETEPYAALIGIDWAVEKHDVWIIETASGQESHQLLEHTPEALIHWLGQLQTRFPGQQLAICLEQSRGALVYALLGHAFLTLYPINPLTLAQYRKAFATSGAKDDPSDARLLAEILQLHRYKLTAWKPEDPHTRQLALLNEQRRKTVDLRTQLAARLEACLALYFPQAIGWVGSCLHSPLACDWLLKWPTLEAIQNTDSQSVRDFYLTHNCRSREHIQTVIAAMATAKPLTQDRPVIDSYSLTVQMLAKQLQVLNGSIELFQQQIARLFTDHPDAFLFKDLPGAGAALAPRLLTAFGTDRDRYPTAQDMQTYSGIAPVIQRSGKQCWIHWRWNSPKFLRQTFHEYAKNSIGFSSWAKAYYQLQRQRGKKNHAAIRALAFKWIRILHRCWQDRIPYEEARYLQRLKQSSPQLYNQINLLSQTT